MKKILGTYSAPRPHWVGDGFPVRSLFGYNGLGRQLSSIMPHHSSSIRHRARVAWGSIRTAASRR